MKRQLLFIAFICPVLLTGCWDSNEPERLVYANGLGIDYKDGKAIAYLQIINLKGVAKQEAGGGSGSFPQADVGRATGGTLEEALFNLYHATDRRVFWGHLSYVIVSQRAAKMGTIKYAADFIDRYRETRYRTYFLITKDSIKDVMLVDPLEGISLAFSKLSDPTSNYNQSSFIPPIDLRQMIINLDEPVHQSTIPILEISKQWSNGKGTKKQILIDKFGVIGVNDYKGTIPKRTALGARLINKDFVRDAITLFPNTTRDVSAIVYNKSIKIKPIINGNDPVRFDITMKLTASIELMKDKTTAKQYTAEIKRTINKEVRKTFEYALKKDIDLFRLSEVLYRKDNKIWKKLEKNGRIPLDKDSIRHFTIKIEIQNSGKQKLTPIFGDRNDSDKNK